MTEIPVPFRDFAVAQVQARETVPPDQEQSYSALMEAGWKQFQDALNRDLTNEEVGQVIHAQEEDIASYWFRQWARDGFIQNESMPNEWVLETDNEKIGVWFDYSGRLSGAPHGYSSIYFKRETDDERATAQFHYVTDPSNGLVLYTTTLYEGPLRDSVQSHEVMVERESIGEKMTTYTFRKHNYGSNAVAELTWTEITGAPDLEGEEEDLSSL